MASQLTWQTESHDPAETEQFASELGGLLRGGEVIELTSDLGGGKTTLTRGLAQGIGSTDRVSSPTFTLRNEYRGTELTIFHFDFYRLDQPGIMSQELDEIFQDRQAVSVIEWADIVEDVLPTNRLTIQLIDTGEMSRRLICSYPESLSYLIPTHKAWVS